MDKAQTILSLIDAFTQLGEQELAHIWAIVHAVKQQGTKAASITPASQSTVVIPEIPMK